MKCKRCQAPDDLNGIGLCKHCMAIVKEEVQAGKKRLDAIYDRFPEDLEGMGEEERETLLEETRALYERLDKYQQIGFPVGSYLMPVRKILHFLEPEGNLEKEILVGRLKGAGMKAALFAALAVAFAVALTAVGNSASARLGEAVNVSAPAESGGDGMAGPEDGSMTYEGPEAGDADGADEEEAADGGLLEGEDGEAAEAESQAETAPAPVRASGGGGAVAVNGARAVAIAVG